MNCRVREWSWHGRKWSTVPETHGCYCGGEGGANLEYSTGWGGVGNADQNSRTSEQTFQARIHSTRIMGPRYSDGKFKGVSAILPCPPSSRSNLPQTVNQCSYLWSSPFLICETIGLGAGQPSFSPSPQPSPVLSLGSL